MQESKIELTDRLRREDRWTAASLYRDQLRKRLRAERMPRKQANEESWRLMAEEFPPVGEDVRHFLVWATFFPNRVMKGRPVEPEFPAVWFLFCRTVALCYALCHSVTPFDQLVRMALLTFRD